MKGQVIAISNQKGGVGKTTVTTLLANLLHFQGGISLGYKVAILDLDNPQFSTFNRRQKMERIFESNPRQLKMLLEVRKQYDQLMVFPATLWEAPSIIKKFQKVYDFIFLDMPGTLNTNSEPVKSTFRNSNFTEDESEEYLEESIIRNASNQHPLGIAYAYVDHFFVPVYQDGDTIRSSIDFFNQIMEVVAPLSPNLKSCQFFFNRVPSKNELRKYKKKLTDQQYPVMENSIYQFRIYENSFRNTIVPIPLQNKGSQKAAKGLLLFANEFLNIIEASDNNIKTHDKIAVNNNQAAIDAKNLPKITEPHIDPSTDLAINITTDIEHMESEMKHKILAKEKNQAIELILKNSKPNSTNTELDSL